MPRLEYVIREEKLNVTESGKEALYNLSGGDMRKILNVLQSTSLAFDVIDEKNVYACVGQPDPQVIKQILKLLLGESIENAIQRKLQFCIFNVFVFRNHADSVGIRSFSYRHSREHY